MSSDEGASKRAAEANEIEGKVPGDFEVESDSKRSKKGGIPVLSVDGTLLCARFMKMSGCTNPHCKMLHLEKSKRPFCPLFSKIGACKFGRGCWYEHKRPEDQAEWVEPNVAIAVFGQHALRLQEYLAEVLPGITVVTKGHVSGGKAENKVLLCRVDGGLTSLSKVLRESHFLDVCVDRVYAVQDSGLELYDVLERVIKSTGVPLEGNKFRVQCYPKELERKLTKCGGPGTLCECCESNTENVPKELRLHLDPKGFTHVLTAVKANERYYAAITRKGDCELPWGGTRRWNSEAVCRAYYKMDEALQVSGYGAGVRALDVGAAPGGWSQCLLQRGANFVTAIDPGELDVSLLGLEGLEHQKLTFQACMPDLLARGEPYDLLVCDMNSSPSEVVNMVKDFMPILAKGARVILTFKKFSSSGKCTQATYAKDKEDALKVLGGWCSEVTLRHLFNNTLDERTVFAQLRDDL